jgi:hypothetical protein
MRHISIGLLLIFTINAIAQKRYEKTYDLVASDSDYINCVFKIETDSTVIFYNVKRHMNILNLCDTFKYINSHSGILIKFDGVNSNNRLFQKPFLLPYVNLSVAKLTRIKKGYIDRDNSII